MILTVSANIQISNVRDKKEKKDRWFYVWFINWKGGDQNENIQTDWEKRRMRKTDGTDNKGREETNGR